MRSYSHAESLKNQGKCAGCVLCPNCSSPALASRKEGEAPSASCSYCQSSFPLTEPSSPLDQVAAEVSSSLSRSRVLEGLLPPDPAAAARQKAAVKKSKHPKLITGRVVQERIALPEQVHVIGGGLDAPGALATSNSTDGGGAGAGATAAPADATARLQALQLTGSTSLASSSTPHPKRVPLLPLFQRRCLACVSKGAPGILVSASPTPFAGLAAMAAAAGPGVPLAATGWTVAKMYRKTSAARATLPSVSLVSSDCSMRQLRLPHQAAAAFAQQWRAAAAAASTSPAEGTGYVEGLLVIQNPCDQPMTVLLPITTGSDGSDGSSSPSSLLHVSHSPGTGVSSAQWLPLATSSAAATSALHMRLGAFDELAAMGLEDDEDDEDEDEAEAEGEESGEGSGDGGGAKTTDKPDVAASELACVQAAAGVQRTEVVSIVWQQGHAAAVRVRVPLPSTTAQTQHLQLQLLLYASLHPAVLADRRGEQPSAAAAADPKPAVASFLLKLRASP